MIDQALVLSGRMGRGHDTVAAASVAVMARRGVKAEIADSIALLGRRRATSGELVFRALLTRPGLYDAFHFSQLRVGGRLARRADAAALHNAWPRFVPLVRRVDPGLILSVFATGAAAAARYQREVDRTVATVVFMTDSYAHRLWVHEGTDLFVVTSHLAAESVRGLRANAAVAVVPPPVRPEFLAAPSRRDARVELGLPADAHVALLMSGGWGIGPLDDAAASLAAAGWHVLAVGGSNQRLAARLRHHAASDARIRPFGYVNRVVDLMAASDVVVTSSGDTCSEARAVGRPLVLLDVVPGHGRENLMHELERGGSVVATAPATLCGAVERAMALAPVAPAGADWSDALLAALDCAGIL